MNFSRCLFAGTFVNPVFPKELEPFMFACASGTTQCRYTDLIKRVLYDIYYHKFVSSIVSASNIIFKIELCGSIINYRLSLVELMIH